MITEHDRVVLTAPVSKERWEIGDVGSVVHVYQDGKAFEVEFTALDGHTAAVAMVDASQVRPIAGKPGDDLAPGTLNSVFKQAGLKP